MAGGLFGFINDQLNKFKSAGAQTYDAAKPTDTGSSLYNISGKQGYNPSELNNDPILQLQLQAIDSQYGGGGGGYSYSGPSIGAIQDYGNKGQARISDLYGQLNQYLQGAQANTAAGYAASTQKDTAAYDQTAKDIQAAKDATTNAINQQAQAGIGAGDSAAKNVAAAQQMVDRSIALNAQNKANALSSLNLLGSGQNAIFNDFMSGVQREKGAQSGKLSDQVSGMISNAQAQIAQAQAKAAAAAQANSDKGKAAKLKAIEDALTRGQNAAAKGDNLSGMQGVMQFAMRAGRPDLAKKFLDMLNASKTNAASANLKAEQDVTGVAKKTTPEEQLWSLIQGTGQSPAGSRVDLSNLNDADRQTLLNEANNSPEFSFLKQYIMPEQNDKAAKIQQQIANMQRQPINSTVKNLQVQSLQQQLKAAQGQTIPESVNIGRLVQNPADVKKYYSAFDKYGQEQDFLSNLYNIYTGKYGKGG
jgi:hypothetical protein